MRRDNPNKVTQPSKYDTIRHNFLEWWDRFSGMAAQRAAEEERELWAERRAMKMQAIQDYHASHPHTGEGPLEMLTSYGGIKGLERKNLELLCLTMSLPRTGLTDIQLTERGIRVAPEGDQAAYGDRLIILPEGWAYEPTDEQTGSNAHILNEHREPIIDVIYRDNSIGRPMQSVYLHQAPPQPLEHQ